MSAIRIYSAGFTPLVCVVPPGAKLSRRSKIKPDQLGKVPGKLGPQGWRGYSWLEAPPPTRAEVVQWDQWGANIGILGAQFPGLDIDVSDETLARVVARFAVERLGEAPVRRSVEPRRLLMYRTAEPFPRQALTVHYRGATHLVEFLGAGRQYVIHGTHPSGVEYRWNTPLWEWAPDDCPLITGAAVKDWLDALEHELTRRGIRCERSGADGLSTPPQEDLEAPSLDRLAEVVREIPNTYPTRDEYIRFLHALKAAGGDEALDIAQEWAGRWTDGDNDPATVARDWEGLRPPFRIGWHWLLDEREALTGKTTAADEFEADPNAAPAPPETPKVRNVKHTDEWAAYLILPALRDRLAYVAGHWYVWQGHVWQRDEEGTDHELIIREALRREALALEERGKSAPGRQGSGDLAMAKRLQSSAGIKAVTDLLRALLAVRMAEFDADPMVLNTPGGVVDLRTGGVSPSDPARRLSRSTRFTPEKMPTPLWDRFLSDLTDGDEELSAFLQRLCGYVLTGDMSEKILAIVWGDLPDTGKSTFERTIRTVMGSYADTVDVEAFTSSRERVPADIARLPGVRFVTSVELAAGQYWDERRVKAITGGDEISARYYYGQWFTFRPQFKIMVVGNLPPSIRVADAAMLRRIVICPLNRQVPEDKRIAGLADRLIAEEGPGILQWMLDGCAMWQRDGLNPPQAVKDVIELYREDEDTIQQWLREECVFGPEQEVSRQSLYESWSVWCRARDERPGGYKTLRRRLRPYLPATVEDALVGGRRVAGYRGIGLRPIGEEFEV